MKTNNSEFVSLNSLTKPEKKIISTVIENVGTPVYIYFQNRVGEQIQQLKKIKISTKKNLQANIKFHYAMLANHNPHIVQMILHEMEKQKIKPGVLCASLGDLRLLQKLYPYPYNLSIIYADAALSLETLSIFEEFIKKTEVSHLYLILQSEGQINDFISWFGKLQNEQKQKLSIGFRIKLDIDMVSDIHSMYHGKNARFGIPIQTASKYIRQLQKLGVASLGLQIYPATNILNQNRLFEIYNYFIKSAKNLINKHSAFNNTLSLFLDFGGGFGFDYSKRCHISLNNVSRAIKNGIAFLNEQVKLKEVLFEPGRIIIGPSGILVSKVIDVKEEIKQRFIILDSGVSHFARPYIYKEQHQIYPLEKKGISKSPTFITGSTMASGDFFAGDPIKNETINFEKIVKGDHVCILDSGAYGFCMSSNFSGLLRPPEVIVDRNNKKWWIVRERETVETLLTEVPLCLNSH